MIKNSEINLEKEKKWFKALVITTFTSYAIVFALLFSTLISYIIIHVVNKNTKNIVPSILGLITTLLFIGYIIISLLFFPKIFANKCSNYLLNQLFSTKKKFYLFFLKNLYPTNHKEVIKAYIDYRYENNENQ
ncbi:Uncharacterised protein [Mycoplasmopsis maculosa]|uniref:Uncharacterized protein n=1 Tax=Mycoplasmopsis maculosa TaxID=114885 RepID=A0A449B5C2_9BACT|nr:hypothetical protein [Mycoplasmopsis maculosa]VEU75803.1 Uncharacterised protein [Mycoplasmopsis maculosa]